MIFKEWEAPIKLTGVVNGRLIIVEATACLVEEGAGWLTGEEAANKQGGCQQPVAAGGSEGNC